MNEAHIDTERFRALLLELCERLQSAQAAGSEAAATVELDQQRQGRLSRMDALGAQAVSVAVGRRRDAMLVRARAALARIDAGGYGHCSECDAAIDSRRLEFDPTVENCIDCARRQES